MRGPGCDILAITYPSTNVPGDAASLLCNGRREVLSGDDGGERNSGSRALSDDEHIVLRVSQGRCPRSSISAAMMFRSRTEGSAEPARMTAQIGVSLFTERLTTFLNGIERGRPVYVIGYAFGICSRCARRGRMHPIACAALLLEMALRSSERQ